MPVRNRRRHIKGSRPMSNLEMRPIDVEVLREFSAGDARQVPATGALVSVARQGATVVQAATCPAALAVVVHVANTGRLQPGDILSSEASAMSLVVEGVAADYRSLTIRNVNPSGATVSLAVGDRIGCTAPATRTTVGVAVTCLHLSVTEVTLRGPQVEDGVRPGGDGSRELSVQAVAASGLSVTLGNYTGSDIVLQAWTPMLREGGEASFTVTQQVVCPTGEWTEVPMRVCMFASGKTIHPLGELGTALVAAGFDDATRVLQVANEASVDVVLGAGSQLVAPAGLGIFADSRGELALGLNVATVNARGCARFYTAETRVDCIVTGGGLAAPASLPDQLGGWVRGGVGWFNAKDYPSIQDAIDALPLEGGTVYIPAGTYTLTETLYTPCDRPCQLVGDGMAPFGGDALMQGTLLVWTENVDMLRLRGDRSSARMMSLRNSSSATSAQEYVGRGITVGRRNLVDPHPAPGTNPVLTEYVNGREAPQHRVLVEDMTVEAATGWGIHVPGFGKTAGGADEPGTVIPGVDGGGGTMAFWVDFRRVTVSASKAFGGCFLGLGSTTLHFENCGILGQGRGGPDNRYAYLGGCVQAIFDRCTFEGLSPTVHPWVTVSNAEDSHFINCWFEEDPSEVSAHTPQYFLFYTYGCRGGSVRECHFARDAGTRGYLRLIQIDPAEGARGLLISNPYALSADASADFLGWENLRYRDGAQIDLGGDLNTDIAVLGPGMYWDQARADPQNLQQPFLLPIQYAHVPRHCTMQGRLIQKLPEGTPDELTPGSVPNGNLMMDRSLPGQGALAYFKSGDTPSWCLANNAPTLTRAERLARGQWATGDVVNDVKQALLVRTGAGWRLVNGAPPLSVSERDAVPEWAVGDIIQNTDIGAPQVKTGSGWRLAGGAPPLNIAARNDAVPWGQGDTILNTDVGAPQMRVGSSWRLVNNVPAISPDVRDDLTDWVAGDAIINSQIGATQIRKATGWRLANNAPSLSNTQRDNELEWSQGDIIYNTTASKLQVRIGSTWKNITLT